MNQHRPPPQDEPQSQWPYWYECWARDAVTPSAVARSGPLVEYGYEVAVYSYVVVPHGRV